MSQTAAPSILSAMPMAAPVQITVTDDLSFVDFTTAQGDEIRLAAEHLRSSCRCAHCIRARIDGVFPDCFDGIAIVEVSPIGDYAINIAFSDGHARGIYPWAYLVGLSEPKPAGPH